MQKTARAILIYENKYVFMKRVKIRNGKKYEYYATIGGHLEENESFEDACIREAFEELGVNIKVDELFLDYVNNEIDTHEKYYFASIISGKIGTGQGEEFTKTDFEKYGSYEIVFVDKKDIANINLLPGILKEKMIKEV